MERAPAGSARNDETDYLRAVVAEGERARKALAAIRDAQAAGALPWAGLFDRWMDAAPDLTRNAGTLKKYRCQLSVLTAWCVGHGAGSPVALSAALAQRYAAYRMKTTVVSGRDVALFSRVWRDLRMGDVWEGVKADAPTRFVTGYRRLTFERAGVRSSQFGKASFHSLRATFISMMDEAGVQAHVTDCITGHAKQGMHGRYSQPSRDALMEAVTRAIVPLGVRK